MPFFHNLRTFCKTGLASCLLISASILPVSAAHAAYPDKPVRLIVPFGAGGITDVVARLIGEKLGDELNQTVVIENRPGAGGTIAAQTVARAKPDGYTLLLGTVGTQVVNSMLYSKLNYDPTAFTPVSLVSNSPYVLAISNIPEVNTLQQLIDYARKNPGKLNYGSAGNGSSPHLGMELLSQEIKAKFTHVPFKSGIEAINAAIGEQVQIVLDAITVIEPQAKAGKLKLLAVADEERNSVIPSLQTGKEQGLSGFVVGSWNAIVGPANMSSDTASILSDAIGKVLSRKEVMSRLNELGIEPLPVGVENYNSHVQAETAKWKKIIDASGTRLD